MKALLPNKFIVPGLTGLTSGLLIAILFHELLESPPKTPLPVPVKEDESEPSPRHDYVGEVKNGKYHGEGVLTHFSGGKYVGQFKDGKFHGHGIYTGVDNSKYLGEWKNGKKHGQGSLTYDNDDYYKYRGQWKDDAWHGHGTLKYSDGKVVEGEWAYGIQYDLEKGEYSCETRPKIVETGSLRIEVYERNQFQPGSLTLENGKKIPECWWISDERFVVYRGETKLVEVDEAEYIDNDTFSLRIRADYPRLHHFTPPPKNTVYQLFTGSL